jgi:hypothetical protein
MSSPTRWQLKRRRAFLITQPSVGFDVGGLKTYGVKSWGLSQPDEKPEHHTPHCAYERLSAEVALWVSLHRGGVAVNRLSTALGRKWSV